MLELIVEKKNLKQEKPPKMKIGSFWTFNEVSDLFGVGQQAVHNSGSSMVKDTPRFAISIVEFLSKHLNYKDDSYYNILDDFNESFLVEQATKLNKFKNDKKFREQVLKEVFKDGPTFEFNDSINIDYLYIVIILFLIKDKNYFKSTHSSHEVTKQSIQLYFKNEEELLATVYSKLQVVDTINYLSDVCYGRYYFLEVHFCETSLDEIRQVPKEIVQLFFETGIKEVVNEEFLLYELEDQIDQEQIAHVSAYGDGKQLNSADNRKPKESKKSSGRKYKVDPKLGKTVIESKNNKCEYATLIGEEHQTFSCKFGQYVEAHHLIPMSAQDDFLPVNIDRTANITVLCPNCHRAIHNGSQEEKLKRLELLYQDRISLLKKVNIDITFDQLKQYYKIMI